MPLYEYVCQTCNAEFELLVRSSDVPTCPSCGGVDLQKQVAKIASEIKYPPSPSPGAGPRRCRVICPISAKASGKPRRVSAPRPDR